MYGIFMIEDEPVFSQTVTAFLQNWGYRAASAKVMDQALEELEAFGPDLVLMDLYLPGINGLALTRKIRSVSNVPILFVSSDDEKSTKISALLSGADDYITKPFDLDLLACKIQALLRRTYDFAREERWLEYGGLHYYPDQYKVTFADQETELTRNEGKILKLLMEKQGKPVSRLDLMDALWNTGSYIDENTLNVNVNRLRKKLEQIGLTDFVRTRKGIGYSL